MKKKIVIWLLLAICTVSGAGGAALARAETPTSSQFTDYGGDYQGKNNWYYYSGSVEGDDLTRMFYCSSGSYWQGRAPGNRIDAMLTQSPDGGYDAVRAYLSPRDMKLSLTGWLRNFCGKGSNGVAVSVVKRSQGGDETLFQRVLPYGAPDLELTKEPGLREIPLGAGDVLFLIVGDNGESGGDYAAFEVLPEFSDVGTAGTVLSAPRADPLSMTEGVFALRIEGGIIRPNDFLLPHMNPAADSERQQVVCGFPPDLADPGAGHAIGFSPMARDISVEHRPYFIPGATVDDTAVQITWGNQFYSNPYAAYTGLRYRVPADGRMSLLGGAASVSEVTGCKLMILRGESWLTQSETMFPKGELTRFAEIPEMNDFSVRAGDEIVYMAYQNAPHTCSTASVVFDYEAVPGTGYLVEESGSEITQASYDSTFGYRQNFNNWYYLYGDTAGDYFKMSCSGNRWTGVDPLNVIAPDFVHPAANYDAIKMWRAPADGTALVDGNVTAGPKSVDGIKFRIQIRRHSPEGYDPPEVLEGLDRTLNGGESLAFRFSRSVKRGDMIFFSVGCGGGIDYDSTTLNTFVGLEKTAEGTDAGSDIGDVRVADVSDWYSDRQGGGNWFYACGTPEEYAMMYWGTGNVTYERWNANQEDCCIQRELQHPGSTLSSLRIYVCDRSGTVDIIGVAQKLAKGGDGVLAGIFHNREKLWQREFGAEELDPFTLTDRLNGIEVQKGDRIFFSVGNKPGGTHAYDSFSFYTEILYTASDEDYAAGEDLSAYLSPADYPALLGVNELPYRRPQDFAERGPLSAADWVLIPLSVLMLGGAAALIFLRKGGKKS